MKEYCFQSENLIVAITRIELIFFKCQSSHFGPQVSERSIRLLKITLNRCLLVKVFFGKLFKGNLLRLKRWRELKRMLQRQGCPYTVNFCSLQPFEGFSCVSIVAPLRRRLTCCQRRIENRLFNGESPLNSLSEDQKTTNSSTRRSPLEPISSGPVCTR